MHFLYSSSILIYVLRGSREEPRSTATLPSSESADDVVEEGVVTHETGIGTAKHSNLTTTWHEAGGEHGPEGAAAGCCARLLRRWADAATPTRRAAMADQRRRRRRQPGEKLQRCHCTCAAPCPCVATGASASPQPSIEAVMASPRPSIATAPSPLLWRRLCSCAAGLAQPVQFLMPIQFVLLRVSGFGPASRSGDGKGRDRDKCEKRKCNSPDLLLARYCPLCGFHAPPHGFAFDETQVHQNASY
ncbi:hypothetical protein PIB30_054057 [Stylosanthes scabra]|uniref:Uncharacterized protein n=1 Tax=Stylosanthes scabra TaxID=79078 RepID=A0ABU6UJH1_9FABA|nr:hypothetical protein [Stylosanthes scabra]